MAKQFGKTAASGSRREFLKRSTAGIYGLSVAGGAHATGNYPLPVPGVSDYLRAIEAR